MNHLVSYKYSNVLICFGYVHGHGEKMTVQEIKRKNSPEVRAYVARLKREYRARRKLREAAIARTVQGQAIAAPANTRGEG